MKDERPDPYTMIGLHKLAARLGGDPVPELEDLLSHQTRVLEENPDVIEFPVWLSTPPLRVAYGVELRKKNNILPFPSRAALAERKTRD